MARKKGSTKTGGRTKGTPNKLSSDVRAMILAALDNAGGEQYLLEQAKKNPNAFLTLVGKCLPKEITGANGDPLIPQTFNPEQLSDSTLRELLNARRAAQALAIH